jgi:hypothetical protein
LRIAPKPKISKTMPVNGSKPLAKLILPNNNEARGREKERHSSRPEED